MTRSIIAAVMMTATLASAGTFTSVTNGWHLQRTNVINEIIESLYARGAYTSTPPYVTASSNVQSRAFLAGLQRETLGKAAGVIDGFTFYGSAPCWPVIDGQYDWNEWINGDPFIAYNLWAGGSLATCSTSLWYEVTGGDGTNGPRRAKEYSHTNTWMNYDDPMYSYGVCTNGDIAGPWIPYDFQMAFEPMTNMAMIDFPFGLPYYFTNETFYTGSKETNDEWSVAWNNLTEVSDNGMQLPSPAHVGYVAQKDGDTQIRAIIVRAVIPIDSLWLNIPHKYARQAYMIGEIYDRWNGQIAYSNAWHISDKQPFDEDGISTVTCFTNNLPASIPPDEEWEGGAYTLWVNSWFGGIVIEIEPPYTQ